MQHKSQILEEQHKLKQKYDKPNLSTFYGVLVITFIPVVTMIIFTVI